MEHMLAPLAQRFEADNQARTHLEFKYESQSTQCTQGIKARYPYE